ncbi:HAD-IC family P-type ATPase [Thioalkalivibrio sp.]|uniref:cation-translocating P-type ATPase n=1 Tax=Thioalkalivibrio sp. TaxID=2093813 RepID=UPI0012D60812|nr:HAD-IC family P-type ATPase [Thioalkalivibrio sp.]TVP79320.1 MAG: HAD family hydrolase [Thioalkalivibrio sp.]
MAEEGNSEDQRVPWHALSGDEALERHETSSDGLKKDEASRRLKEYGPNQLRQEKKRPAWKRFLDQFNNVLMLILIVAGGASVLLGEMIDAAAIFGVVLIIALVGFIQEGKAENALESIKEMLSPEATVIRSGKTEEIPAEEVVPGDIVEMSSGDRVPADVRLLEAKRFRTQEASLTGESEAVDKATDEVEEDTELAERTSMAFAGTTAVQGKAKGVVVETGSRTEIGRISEMLEEVEDIQTPLLRDLDSAGKKLAAIIVGAAVVVGLIGVLVHGLALPEAFMAAVALAVASIPEGLPAIVTITLALGVQAMARRNAIIRKLPAVETLGSTTIIFSDKTGTLTRNEMTAQAIMLADGEVQISGVGFAPDGDFHRNGEEPQEGEEGEGQPSGEQIDPAEDALLKRFLVAGALCNDASLRKEDDEWNLHGDPTEGALIVVAAKAGYDRDELREQWERQDSIPFESERQFMATLDSGPEGESRIHVKGAPDRILEMCSSVRTADGEEDLDAEAWEKQIEKLSSRGLRVLAVAEKPANTGDELTDEAVEKDLVLLGLVGLLDPPRETAIEAIKKCLEAGIRPIMVTGDHGLTARAIAARLGLRNTEEAISGRELADMSDEELQQRIEEVDVYARASPEDKLRMVEAAQADGEVCAMTGDGVNDAPALKRADVGVAMGIEGTEAAKEASEMVLADDNFASIVNAVEEGRKVYDNIKKTIIFLLPTNGGQGLAIAVAVAAGTMLPVTPVQALWVNMVVAVTLGLALGFEPGEQNLMQRKPRDPNAPLLDMFLLWRVLFVSLLLLAGVYGMFLWLLNVEGVAEEVARSGAVNLLVFASAAYLINSRYLTGSSLSLRGIFGSRPVWIAIGLVVLFQLAWTYTPPMQVLFSSGALALHHWGIIIASAVLLFLLVEAEKAIWRWRSDADIDVRGRTNATS